MTALVSVKETKNGWAALYRCVRHLSHLSGCIRRQQGRAGQLQGWPSFRRNRYYVPKIQYRSVPYLNTFDTGIFVIDRPSLVKTEHCYAGVDLKRTVQRDEWGYKSGITRKLSLK